MASLTQTSITTRKVVRYSIYFIIFLIIARVVLGVSVSIIQKLFPPRIVPTVQFGNLPALPFPSKGDLPKITYTLEIPEGNLPKFATAAKVYYMPPSKSDLLALDKAKTLASSLGFASEPKQVTSTIYQFTNTNSQATFEINIISGTFSIGYNLNSDSSPLSAAPVAADQAATTAKSFLSRGGLLADDLTGPVTPEYLKVQNKQLVSANSLSEANLTKVNLFRKDYDKLPSVTESPSQGNVWFILSGSNEQGKQIIQAQYYYYPVDETQFATYPIITSDEAFKELQSGNGFVANLGDNNDGKVTVRRVYLAYYDAGLPMKFYQPVIVFEGDNGFVAYVPAVTSTYYSK